MLRISRQRFISTSLLCFTLASRPAIATPHTNLKAEPVFENSLDPTNPYVAVIGDSISTGVLANTFAGQNLEPSFWLQILGLLFSDWQDPDAIHKALSNPHLAAATTTEPYGLRAALKTRWQLPDLGVLSVAKFGAKSTTVPRLLTTLQAEVGAGRKPDFVYLMLGGNDFCSDQTLEEFKLHYQDAMTLVHTAYPDSHLIVAPLPPVYQLASLKEAEGKASPTPRKISCEQLRQLSCKRIFEADAQDRNRAMNQIVEEAFAQSAYSLEKKTFVARMGEWTLKEDDMAADCFHPSAEGQRVLGTLLNEAINPLTFGTN